MPLLVGALVDDPLVVNDMLVRRDGAVGQHLVDGVKGAGHHWPKLKLRRNHENTKLTRVLPDLLVNLRQVSVAIRVQLGVAPGAFSKIACR